MTITSPVVVMCALSIWITDSVLAMATEIAKPFKPLGLANARAVVLVSTVRLSATITVGATVEVPMLTWVIARTYVTAAPTAFLSRNFRMGFWALVTAAPSNCSSGLAPKSFSVT